MTDQDDRTPHEILQCLEWLSTPRATILGTEDPDLVAALELAHQALLAAQMRFNGHDLTEPDNFRERLLGARDVLLKPQEERDERVLQVLDWASKQEASDSVSMTVLETARRCVSKGVNPQPKQPSSKPVAAQGLTPDDLRAFTSGSTVRHGELELATKCIEAWANERGKWTALRALMTALREKRTTPGALKRRFLRAADRMP